MLQPKRTKFRKQHKGRNRGLAQAGNKVSFGTIGLKAVSRGRLTARQIEAARRAMTRHVKRGGKIWIRVFPDKPITENKTHIMKRGSTYSREWKRTNKKTNEKSNQWIRHGQWTGGMEEKEGSG